MNRCLKALFFFYGMGLLNCNPQSPDAQNVLEDINENAQNPTEEVKIDQGAAEERSRQDSDINNTLEADLDQVAGAKLKIRNYEELYQTMAILTSVDPANTDIRAEFDARISGSLPTANDASGYTASHQVANFKLASLFCNKAFENSETYGSLFFNVEVDQDLESEVISRDVKANLAKNLITNFWRLDQGTELDENATSLVQLMSELEMDMLAEGTQSRDQVLRGMALGACAGVLSSMRIAIY